MGAARRLHLLAMRVPQAPARLIHDADHEEGRLPRSSPWILQLRRPGRHFAVEEHDLRAQDELGQCQRRIGPVRRPIG
eukprot:7385107-Prymnesium_polylepis.1